MNELPCLWRQGNVYKAKVLDLGIIFFNYGKIIIIKFFKRITTFRPIYELENVFIPLQQLAIFLSNEVDCFGSFRLTRLINSLEEGDETSGNLMTLEKRGNDVYIGDLYYNGPEDEQEYFIISIPELIKIMKKWDKLIKEKPEEIILSEQDGRFELVGKNSSQKTTNEVMES